MLLHRELKRTLFKPDFGVALCDNDEKKNVKKSWKLKFTDPMCQK